VRVVFLGTAGSFPTIDRGLPAIAVHRGKELFLFDCGEGAQRQMFIAQIGFRYPLRVFISHLHGDHVLGLPGLLQTMSLFNVTHPVEVYGPPGIHSFFQAIVDVFRFRLPFPLQVLEVTEGTVCDEEEYWVQAAWTEHRVPNLAYALLEKERPGKFYPAQARALGVPEGPLWSQLQHGLDVTLDDGRVIVPAQVVGPPRRGRKIVYSGDTKPCAALLALARDADLLIHEATVDDALAERAGQYGHSTPRQAASLAKEANVKRLVLTHISMRYTDAEVLRQQAAAIFPNVTVAEDFMELTVPYPD
jgi:ribonuclease Z